MILITLLHSFHEAFQLPRLFSAKTIGPFMNHGLERMWKPMALVIGLIMPGRSDEYHKTIRNIQGKMQHFS